MTREEFGAAYQRHFRRTVSFLISNGLSPDAAQEIAQAAWVRGWERLSQLRDERTLPIWLNRVALNLYRSVLRREPEYEELARNAVAPDPSMPDVNLPAIDAQAILGRCSVRDQRMLNDYYLKGLHLSEIAERNGWRENTARVRLFRARQAARFSARLAGALDSAESPDAQSPAASKAAAGSDGKQ